MEPSTRNLHFNLDERVVAEEAYITTHYEFDTFLIGDSLESLEHNWNEGRDWKEREFLISNNENLVSPEVKVLIYVSRTFYHFFIDSLAMILKIHKQNPGVRFVLYLDKHAPNKEYDKLLDFLFGLLEALDAKYSTVPTSPGYDFAPVYKFSNYVVVDKNMDIHKEVTLLDVKYAMDLAIEYSLYRAVNTGKPLDLPVPHRKIYLTRGGAGTDIGEVEFDKEYGEYGGYTDDVRLLDEHKLEEYLSSNGYEILQPEVRFRTTAEQILYMAEVKSLVAVTCSGLANVIFMQPGQTVIEIQSEIVQVVSVTYDKDGYEKVKLMQGIHNFYPPLSFMRNALHVCVPTNRDAEAAVARLKETSLIR